MLTRRDVLKAAPALWMARGLVARGAEAGDYEKIDSHTHIHLDAPAVFASLKASRWSGLDLVVCPTQGDEAYDLEARIEATMRGAKASGGRIAWASTFDARGFDQKGFTERTVASVARTFEGGAVGVKIWKNIGMAIRGKDGAYLLPDDRALLPVYESIEKAGRTLIAHLAEPDGAWLPLDEKNPEFPYYSKNPQWHMVGKGRPSKEAILGARDKVLARYPKLRVVGCHLGSDEDDLTRLARRLDQYANFAVDTAARVRYFARGDREKAREFLVKYQDRILYGTDYGLRDAKPEDGARTLLAFHDRDWKFFGTDEAMEYEGRPTRGLKLPEGVLRKLFRENAKRWIPGVGV